MVTNTRKQSKKEQAFDEKHKHILYAPDFDDEYLEKLAERLLQWLDDPNTKTYFIGDFAVEHGLHRVYFPRFCKRSESFRKAYLIAKQAQESWLVHGGLKERYNANFCYRVLCNMNSWADRLMSNDTELVEEKRDEQEFINAFFNLTPRDEKVESSTEKAEVDESEDDVESENEADAKPKLLKLKKEKSDPAKKTKLKRRIKKRVIRRRPK